MARFNIKDYQTVEDRLREFLSDHKDARVLTELEHFTEDGSNTKGKFIVKAIIYLNGNDLGEQLPKATGYAEEIVGQGMVNGTSALENCETSAIGRALANAGYAPKGKRPSREEMIKVASRETKTDEPLMSEEQVAKLKAIAEERGKDADAVVGFARTQPASTFDKLMERVND
jgi:hypothetical protein